MSTSYQTSTLPLRPSPTPPPSWRKPLLGALALLAAMLAGFALASYAPSARTMTTLRSVRPMSAPVSIAEHPLQIRRDFSSDYEMTKNSTRSNDWYYERLELYNVDYGREYKHSMYWTDGTQVASCSAGRGKCLVLAGSDVIVGAKEGCTFTWRAVEWRNCEKVTLTVWMRRVSYVGM